MVYVNLDIPGPTGLDRTGQEEGRQDDVSSGKTEKHGEYPKDGSAGLKTAEGQFE
jgi:hypothetical protein